MNKQYNSGQIKNWRFHFQNIDQFIQCNKSAEKKKQFNNYCFTTNLEELNDANY